MLNTIEKPTINVLIAIQARSTSTRFPNKIFQTIGNKTALEHVIHQAKSSKQYLERGSHKFKLNIEIAILHPDSDVAIPTAYRHLKVLFVKGDEHDVLGRYLKAQATYNPNYIVRLTSDCPLILDFMISKHINSAVFNELDYISNVDEDCRTVADGMDVEVISAKAMRWLEENVSSSSDREHVTHALRRIMPKELQFGFVTSKHDSSDQKLSLDTKEDLEMIRKHFHNREYKKNLAQKKYGKHNIYEI